MFIHESPVCHFEVESIIPELQTAIAFDVSNRDILFIIGMFKLKSVQLVPPLVLNEIMLFPAAAILLWSKT